MLGGHLRLDAPPRPAVPGDHDLALDVDAAPLQLLVVGRDAVVHVDQLAGHVAVGRVGVVGRKPVLLDLRGTVLLQRGLAKPRGVARRGEELEGAGPGRGVEHPELLDLGVEAPGPELPGGPLRHLPVVGGARPERLPGEDFHAVPEPTGVDLRVEAGLERVLLHGGGR